MQGLECDVQLSGSVELCEISNNKLWVVQSCTDRFLQNQKPHSGIPKSSKTTYYEEEWKTHEFDCRRFFNLRNNSSSNVVTHLACVPDAEAVRPRHLHLPRLTAVQVCHALNLWEGHEVACFQVVARLVQCKHDSVLVLSQHSSTRHVMWHSKNEIVEDSIHNFSNLCYQLNHGGSRWLSIYVIHHEFLAEVAKDLSTKYRHESSLKIDFRWRLMLCGLSKTNPKSPRVSATMKWMSFEWQKSPTRFCSSRDEDVKTTT